MKIQTAAFCFFGQICSGKCALKVVLLKYTKTNLPITSIADLESQISSIISPQSEIIPTRNFLEKLWDDYVDMHKNNAHERPTFWGGYKLMPTYFEFWQGRVNRLHDRIIYEQTETGWNTYRLAP